MVQKIVPPFFFFTDFRPAGSAKGDSMSHDKRKECGERDSWPSMGAPQYAPLCLPAAARESAAARDHQVQPQAEWALRTVVEKPKEEK